MTDSDVPDRSRTALYTWEAIAEAGPDTAEVTLGKVTVTQPPEPETFTGQEDITVTIPDVVGIDEVAEILGLTHAEIDELRKREAGDEFPIPTELASGPVWDARWIRYYAASR